MFWTLAAFAQEPHVLGRDSGTLADGRPLDIFSFQLEAGERVVLQVESKAFDPQAMLLSPARSRMTTTPSWALALGWWRSRRPREPGRRR
jgi:hypothetical protein